MLFMYAGMNDRIFNMNKSGKKRNITMYSIENMKTLQENEKELEKIMKLKENEEI